MKNTLLALSVLTGISVALDAQSTSDQQVPSTAGQQQSEVLPKPGQTAAPPQASSTVQLGQQSWPGVLLDASCPAIAPTRSGTSPSATGVTIYTGSSSQPSSATTAGAAGTPTPTEDKAPLSRNTTATDVSPARSTTEAAAQATRDERPTSATPVPPSTTETKAAGANGVSPAGSPATTGERSRTVHTDATTTSWFTAVKDKYRDCMAKSTTTAFAVQTEQGLMVLDEAGNLAVRQAMLSDDFRTGLTDGSGNPRWMSVTVNGSVRAGKLTVTTVGR